MRAAQLLGRRVLRADALYCLIVQGDGSLGIVVFFLQTER